jgi:acyl dehydratase
MIDGRHFEDLAAGQVFEHGAIAVTAENVVAFAREFDPQVFHLNEDAAKDTFFAGLAASGWHTAAMTMRLIVDSGIKLAGGIIGAGGSLIWPRPTRPGDILSIRIEVLELRASRSKPERGTLKARVTTRNQHGDELQIMTCDLLVWRRQPAD